MGRKPRIHFPGAFYHVINRGNQRQEIYWDEADFERMLEKFKEASQHYQLLIHAYCLMPNHFHLLAEVGEHPLGLAMKSVETGYVRHFNRRHQKCGHVFQARYRAIVCDKPAYLLELVRYIHLNPVRVGLVSCADGWKWSSHRAYLGLAQTDWLYQSDVMACFGLEGRVKLVDYLTQARDSKPHPEYYRPERFPLLGRDGFPAVIPPGQEPRRQPEASYPGPRLSLEAIADCLARSEGLHGPDLKGRGGGYRVSRMRDEMVLAALHFFSYPANKVAHFLKLSPSAVTRSQ
jgi:putative transposase